MTRLQRTIFVNCPIENAFRYTADFNNIEQWDPGVSASGKLTPGPVGEGTEFRVRVAFGPSSTDMTYVVRTWEPPARVVLEGTGGAIHALDEITFTSKDGGTSICYTAEITLGGIAGLAQPFMGPLLERVGKRAVDGLRDALTAQAEVPGRSLLTDLMDRLVLPGAIGFTRLGYRWRKRSWAPMPTTLEGRTAVVTGATSGLGRIVAEDLAALGARVVCVGRDPQKLERVREEIASVTGNADIVGELADLGLMSEVRDLAARLLEREPRIHILVNNAAVLPAERTMTEEGLETTFATDLLSPFVLTELLLPKLEASAPARIVNVSSGGMYLAAIDLGDLQNAAGKFDGARAYAKAKRGLVMLTEHWAERLRGSGVVVNAMHPGWADTPGVENSLPGFYRLTRSILRTPREGADTIVWLAAATEAGEVSGQFWLDRTPHTTAILPGTRGTRAQQQDLADSLRRIGELG
jgi:NAD(P)-dependent dehydrogenase (short-subunit alcohol dehydrogenase family)/carbon monoxide dehydrogenase subunit G